MYPPHQIDFTEPFRLSVQCFSSPQEIKNHDNVPKRKISTHLCCLCKCEQCSSVLLGFYFRWFIWHKQKEQHELLPAIFKFANKGIWQEFYLPPHLNIVFGVNSRGFFGVTNMQKIIKQMFIIQSCEEKHLLFHYHPSAFAVFCQPLLSDFSP